MKKVVVWGKFDTLHEAHTEFLKNAKNLGDELYVVVIPDNLVIENTGKPPKKTAEERKYKLKELNFIKEVYIDSLTNGLDSILNLKPDIFAFGYDQKTKWEEQVKQYLSANRIYPRYIRLKTHNKEVHSSNLR